MRRVKSRLSILRSKFKTHIRKLIDGSRAEVTEPNFVLKHIK